MTGEGEGGGGCRTFLLLGLLVADGEADGDAGVQHVAVAVAAVAQQGVQGVGVLLQQHGLLQTRQVLPARLVVAAQHVLHQGLLLHARTDRQTQTFLFNGWGVGLLQAKLKTNGFLSMFKNFENYLPDQQNTGGQKYPLF